MKSPEQDLFDTMFSLSLSKGYRTFDYLPAAEESYPFVYIGNQFETGRYTKAHAFGNIVQRIIIYHTHRNRRDMTTMLDELRKGMMGVREGRDNYLTFKRANSQVLIDRSTGTPLLQGIIEVEYRYNRKGGVHQ